MSLQSRWPTVAFSTADLTADIRWHGCPDFGHDDHESTVTVRYQRWGSWHEIACCGLCVGAELVYLHSGRPAPLFVTVVEAVEAERSAAA
ncbi:MAG: hypothetical protein M3N43_03050 [Actinomycetota bacterium]|nr:hypothetical protein [Actinomycetota bacterium]